MVGLVPKKEMAFWPPGGTGELPAPADFLAEGVLGALQKLVREPRTWWSPAVALLIPLGP